MSVIRDVYERQCDRCPKRVTVDQSGQAYIRQLAGWLNVGGFKPDGTIENLDLCPDCVESTGLASIMARGRRDDTQR